MEKRDFLFVGLMALIIMLLAACSSSDDIDVNNGKNVISLSAGIGGTESSVITRADTYSAFTANTSIKTRVAGTWTGHTPENVIQYPTGTAGTITSSDNALTLSSPVIYWDDYGTADEANASTGRTSGLTIYGAAINANAGTVSFADDAAWSSLSWTVAQNQTGANAWAPYDLLISNNIKGGNTYKFADRGTAGHMIFKHAMSEITINLLEGEGFTDAELTGGTSTATLNTFRYAGSVDVADGTSAGSTVGDIQMKLTSTNTDRISSSYSLDGENARKPYATFTGLVFPAAGQFVYSAESKPAIATIVVNKNVYEVNAEAIIAAIDKANNTTGSTTAATEMGKNYVFNVVVTKTKVEVSATVTDWVPITAATQTPSNATTASFYAAGTSMTSDFDLLLSTKTSTTAAIETGTTGFTTSKRYNYSSGSFVPADGKVIYWPDNDTYYHFRGITPTDQTVTDGDYVTLNSNNETFTDVMWGAPYQTGGTTLFNALGPTSTPIGLTFMHKMARVIFVLETTAEGSADRVDLTGTNTVLLNCKASGRLHLAMGTIDNLSATTSSFSTSATTSYKYTESGSDVTKTGYLFGAVPQSTSGLSIKVTSTDHNVYPISDLSTIKVNGTSNAITSWEPGKTYIYTLTLKKTGIAASVTALDWSTITTENTIIKID
jgi:hypothetical protein